MNITSAQAQKILSGSQSFSQLGFSMLLTRLRGMYVKNPTGETLAKCTNEINVFLGKFDSIMANDYSMISKL